MAHFAQVDYGQSPPLVVGYFDTVLFPQMTLPPQAQLVELSDADWAKRSTRLGWTIEAGALVAIITAPEQAVAALQAALAKGIAVTAASAPTLDATYALDQTTLAQIGAVARDAGAGLGLPGGGDTFSYPDMAGVPHTFTAAQMIALYKAMRDLLLTLNTQGSILAHGGPAVWPAQVAELG